MSGDTGFQREIVERNLSCGTRLMVTRNPGLPLFTVSAFFDAGHMVEADGEDGLLALASRLMLSGGAGQRTGEQIFDLLESSGVRYSSSGGGIKFEAVTEKLDLVLDVLVDTLTQPRFDEARFEIERGRLVTDLQAAEGNLRVVARQKFGELIYGDCHPLGRPTRGTAASVAAFTRDQVAEKHSRHAGPASLIIAIAGDVDPDQVTADLETRLSGWNHPTEPRPELPTPVLADTPQDVLLERKKEKLHLFIGHLGIRRNCPDLHALLLFDNILGSGAGFTSRLARRVRDEMGLAYTVGASITASAGREPGVFSAYVGTFPDKRQAATSAVRDEIACLLDEGGTAKELEAARRYLRGSFLFDTETNAQLADLSLLIALHDLGIDYPTRHLEALDAVTLEQVNAAGRRHIHPNHLHTVAAGKGEVG